MKLPFVLILPAPDVSLVLDLCVSRQSELRWCFLPLPCVALGSRRPRVPALGLPPSVWYSASQPQVTQAAKFCKSLPAGDSCTAGRHHLWWPFRAGYHKMRRMNVVHHPWKWACGGEKGAEEQRWRETGIHPCTCSRPLYELSRTWNQTLSKNRRTCRSLLPPWPVLIWFKVPQECQLIL